jgi:hypothetical protein
MAKKVLRFAKGTLSDGFVFDLAQAAEYCDGAKLAVGVFSDADFANDSTDRKSVTGFVVFCNCQRICAKSKYAILWVTEDGFFVGAAAAPCSKLIKPSHPTMKPQDRVSEVHPSWPCCYRQS